MQSSSEDCYMIRIKVLKSGDFTADSIVWVEDEIAKKMIDSKQAVEYKNKMMRSYDKSIKA